jgi:hypothetical protein
MFSLQNLFKRLRGQGEPQPPPPVPSKPNPRVLLELKDGTFLDIKVEWPPSPDINDTAPLAHMLALLQQGKFLPAFVSAVAQTGAAQNEPDKAAAIVGFLTENVNNKMKKQDGPLVHPSQMIKHNQRYFQT